MLIVAGVIPGSCALVTALVSLVDFGRGFNECCAFYSLL